MASQRKPLTEVSGNRNDRLAGHIKNEVRALRGPALGRYEVSRPEVVHCLREASVVHSSSASTLDTSSSDEYYSSHIHSVVSPPFLSQLIEDLEVKDDRWVKSYDSGFEFDGMCDYSTSVAYGVDPPTLHRLLRSTTPKDYANFFKAEGLFARLVLTLPDHHVRLMCFEVWMILVARFCGYYVFRKSLTAYKALRQIQPHSQCCPGPGRDMFEGFFRYSDTMCCMNKLWSYAIRVMDATRQDYIDDWCYSVQWCALHGLDCVGRWEVSALSWGDRDDSSECDTEINDENIPTMVL